MALDLSYVESFRELYEGLINEFKNPLGTRKEETETEGEEEEEKKENDVEKQMPTRRFNGSCGKYDLISNLFKLQPIEREPKQRLSYCIWEA